jgi:hypothetical protein
VKTKYYRREQAGGTRDENYMCDDEPKAKAQDPEKHGPTGVHTGINKRSERRDKERSGGGEMSGKRKRGTRRSGADHVLTSLTLRVTMPTVPDPISRWASGWSEVALGRVPRVGDDDEGRAVNVVKSILRHLGVGGARRRYGVETIECTGGESTESSGPREGAEVNRNKSEINRK